MDSLRPILWREGMFLLPHHLQQHDRFLAWREEARLAALQPDGWGFLELKIQEGALQNFRFEIDSAQLIFPSGFVAMVPQNASVAGRSFEEFLQGGGRPMDVLLGLRRLQPQGRNVREADTGEAGETRFVSVIEERVDASLGGNPGRLEFLRGDLRLFFGDEPTEDFETIKVTEVVNTGMTTNPIVQADRYTFPCLRLSASQGLWNRARKSLDLVVGAARRLSEDRDAMFQTSDPTNQSKLLRLHVLNTFIPRLRQWIETGTAHPMRAFFELASLAGALGTMPGAQPSWDLPLYEHRDAAPVFDALFGYIADVLETSDPTNWEKVGFSREGDFFVADLGTVTLDRESKFILSVRAPVEEAQLKTTLRPGSAKFGSPTKVPHYHRNALRGIDFQVLSAAPPDIPADTGCVYVRVETLHRDWAKVEEERSLAAMLPGVPPETQLELFIVRRGGGRGR